MEEYILIVPVTGAITINITAESIEEAVEKTRSVRKHPCGKLNLELDKVVVIPVESKTFN